MNICIYGIHVSVYTYMLIHVYLYTYTHTLTHLHTNVLNALPGLMLKITRPPLAVEEWRGGRATVTGLGPSHQCCPRRGLLRNNGERLYRDFLCGSMQFIVHLFLLKRFLGQDALVWYYLRLRTYTRCVTRRFKALSFQKPSSGG